MSDIRKYVTLIESFEQDDVHPLERSIMDGWDEYDDIEDLVDGEGLDEILDDLLSAGMTKEVEYLLKQQGVGFQVYQSHRGDKAYIAALSNDMAIYRSADGSAYYVYSEPDEIVYGWDDDDVLGFFNHDHKHESDEFWSSVDKNTFAYHATNKSNIENILKYGLKATNDTRGLTNKETGAAVFTTLDINELELGTYGDTHFKINLGKMKEDGYMPPVMEEEPLIIDKYRSALAHMFDVEYEDNSSDLSYNTLVIFGDIPPKYIEEMN